MITKVVWDNDFLLGVPEIDEQHKKLVSFIEKFHDALVGDENTYYLNREEVINELLAYTVYHFETEENLFIQHEYEAGEFHKSQHRTFASEVKKQATNVLVADVAHGKEFYKFLVTWLLSHIAKADRAFCTTILEKKAKEKSEEK